ncbi:MAG: PAS domain-containing protein, partial [Calditrichaeota bacterium]|nr:PAS domain-containing protein [Calditrichota bacterium]
MNEVYGFSDLQAILDQTREAVIGLSADGKVLLWNQSAQKLYGYPADEICGKPWLTLILGAKHDKWHRFFDAVAGNPAVAVPDLNRMTQSGIVVRVKSRCLLLSGNHPISMMLFESNDFLRGDFSVWNGDRETEHLLNSMSTLLIGIDADDVVRRWNAAAERILGLPGESVLGKNFFQTEIRWHWPEIVRRIMEGKEERTTSFWEDVDYMTPSGQKGVLNLFVNPIQGKNGQHLGYLLVGMERTAARQVEQQLMNARKLEAVGQLAAGVAHEINTPIQYIGDNIRFMSTAVHQTRERLSLAGELAMGVIRGEVPREKARELLQMLNNTNWNFVREEINTALEESLTGLERVTKIVSAMRAFSHVGGTAKSRQNLNKVLDNAVTVTRNEWKYAADLERDFEEELPHIDCYIDELNQVFLNIIVNAAQAIADKKDRGESARGKI